jgi:hypothetical protein
MKKTKLYKVIDYILDIKTSRILLAFKNNGYLLETGWLKSFKLKQPVDATGKPIPWTTYSFIRFIENHLNKEMSLFEYGSGNSTFFYAEHVKSLITVEHNKSWYEKLIPKIPGNVKLILKDLDVNYENCINENEFMYDMIIIDGRRRNKCIEQSIKHIRPDGLIVLDDSEREKYKEGIEFLRNNNFKQIDFWGISPAYFQEKCTSIFFKEFKF